MADEDKEKAEKLAAAKKRFEELKKQQAKKGGKKAGGKKKKEKDAKGDGDDAGDNDAEPADADAVEDDGDAIAADEKAQEVSEEVKAKVQRPESSAHSEVQELYKKQAARIEELEKENKALKEQNDEHSKKLAKTEEELETIREGSGDAAELKSKAKEAERLSTELASVQRQLSQAQQAAGKAPIRRRQSGNSPEADTDTNEQLANKDSTIHSLELDISSLRNQIITLESSLAESSASLLEANERTTAAEAATTAAKQELESLKLSLAIPSDETAAANQDGPEALTKRISVLESDLRSATSNLEAASKRATSLEEKISTLTKLHKESLQNAQVKDRELNDLRSQLKRHARPSHVRDASEFELNEDETDEIGALQSRIRALEAENFDLRRGVWRDRRAELQPGMEDNNYEDVDLNTPLYGAGGQGQHRGSFTRQSSTFQDVITSGINAFTGREPSARTPAQRERAMSMGLLSEDDGFDEEAFRLAQEQEQKNRIERIKEVKRGLEQWRGWRIDLSDLRQKGAGPGREVGPVFEV